MLQVTDDAVAVLKDFLAGDDVQGEAIRLTPSVRESGQTVIEIVAISAPTERDVLTQTEGLDVFVAPELAPALDDQVLDASPTAQGPQFSTHPQEGEEH